MAIINQSPLGQTSRSLANLDIDLVATASPSWIGRKTVSGATVPYSSRVRGAQFIAGLIGRTRSTTASAASGIFTPNEQAAAKRLGAWP